MSRSNIFRLPFDRRDGRTEKRRFLRAVDRPALSIRDASALHALSQSQALFSGQPLAVTLPHLSTREIAAINERLNRHRRDCCGCSLGAQCMTVAFVMATVWLWARHGFTAALFWRMPVACGAAFFGAGAGKIAGGFLARRRLRREIRLLLDRFPIQ
jgi:hypothetical protein